MEESSLVSLVQMLIQRIQESHDSDTESILKEKLILFLQHATQVRNYSCSQCRMIPRSLFLLFLLSSLPFFRSS